MKKTFAVLLGTLTLCLSTGISASAVNCDNIIMQNDYLTLYVGQEKQNLGRYQLSANKGDLINHGDEDFLITAGMRIAQLVISSVVSAEFIAVASLKDSARGEGGFGSSGTN